MKTLFTIFSFGYLTFVFACPAVAQKSDSLKGTYKIRCKTYIKEKDNSLISVGGVLYEGDLSKKDTSEILVVDIQKRPLTWDKHASYKVTIVKIRELLASDTIKRHPSIDTIGQAIYIVDGKLSHEELEGVNPDDIFSMDILKSMYNKDVYVNTGNRGAIIVITKKFVIQSYQKKLSAFSKEYRSYLETHQRDSADLFYVINGVPLDGKDENEITGTLYDIPRKRLKSVTFMDKYFKGAFNNSKPLVIIVTKK